MTSRNSFARRLRNNPTVAEYRLWQSLRNSQLGGYKFTRQFPIGNYVVDFCCRGRRLVVEVDGGGHDVRGPLDEARTEFLRSHGFSVLRFWNSDVLGNVNGVLESIIGHLER